MTVETEDGSVAVDDVEVQANEEVETEAPEAEAEATEEAATEDADDGKVVVSFGQPKEEEPEHEKAPAWVKEVRKQNRELARKVRELEEEKTRTQVSSKPKLGPKPTREQFDFDDEKHEQALEVWTRQKLEAEAEERRAVEAAKREQEEWGQTVNKYREAKKALPVVDFDDAENAVVGALDLVRQNILLAAAEKPEALVYALGRDEERLKQVAAIKDPIKFAAAIAKLETQLTVTTKKSPPKPARVVSGGNAPVSGVTDSRLEKLRAEAEKTGDYSAVVAYKREKALKGK